MRKPAGINGSEDFLLEVTVNDRPVYEYDHQGDTYIEGRKGTTFKLKFHNRTYNRVLIVPAVDGLSTLDGSTAGPDSPGLVVAAQSSVTIPGWMVDQSRASEFIFADRESSYARSVNPTTTNTGVIGLMVFAENVTHYYPLGGQVSPSPLSTGYPPFNPIWSINNMIIGSNAVETTKSAFSSGSANAESVSYNSALGMAPMGGPSVGSGTSRRITIPSKPVEEAIGVGWGQSVNFATNAVEFDKGSNLATFVVFYDTRKNLERRGIVVERRETASVRPNPFPGVGCAPPKGWRG